MPKDILNEREFELVNIVGAKLAHNQRDLSHQMDMSLGMTNMLIKRLVTKGYIRIQQLNKRKIQYILTPKGFAEKMRKSVNYTLKTINSISLIKENLKSILLPLYNQGERIFYVVGKSDLAFLIDVVFKENSCIDVQAHHVDDFPKGEVQGTILICKEIKENELDVKGRYVHLIMELAKNETGGLDVKR